jgi:transposase
MKSNQGNKSRKSPYSDDLRKKVAEEYLTGTLSHKELAEKYGFPNRNVVIAIVAWYKRNYDISAIAIRKNTISNPTKEQALVHLEERAKQLEKALEYAQLKISGLEVMIDVAEKELNIAIRKKSGTKQSKP